MRKRKRRHAPTVVRLGAQHVDHIRLHERRNVVGRIETAAERRHAVAYRYDILAKGPFYMPRQVLLHRERFALQEALILDLTGILHRIKVTGRAVVRRSLKTDMARFAPLPFAKGGESGL